MKSFCVKTNILLNGGLVSFLDQMHRVFLVTDPYMRASGKTAYVTASLCRAEREFRIFSEVSADPDTHVVAAGVERLLKFQPDTVVGLGGGAVIDAAKAIAHVAAASGKAEKFLFVAIPTTSGTGSEVTRFSVITDREASVKYPLVDDSLLPDVAVLDAGLVLSVPPDVTADTGIDTLTHAIEAFVSTEHNDFADAAAEKAIRLIKEYLPAAYREPKNVDARERVHNASCLAGIAFSNTGLGLNHGMAHGLGAHFHIPHGRANGILLPYVIRHNAGLDGALTPAAERYARIACLLGVGGYDTRASVLNLLRVIRNLLEKMKMPTAIQAAGVSREAFECSLTALTESALADRCTATNPKPCTEEEISELFQKAYCGK